MSFYTCRCGIVHAQGLNDQQSKKICVGHIIAIWRTEYIRDHTNPDLLINSTYSHFDPSVHRPTKRRPKPNLQKTILQARIPRDRSSQIKTREQHATNLPRSKPKPTPSPNQNQLATPKTNQKMPQLKDPDSYRKPCTLCHKPRDVLVRCQIDPNTLIPPPPPPPPPATTSTSTPSNPPSNPNDNNNNNETPNEIEQDPAPNTPQTTPTPTPQLKPNSWHFVCPGSCWRRVSGGVVDGDLAEGRRGYRYGGMWKNRHAGVSAKVPRRLKGKLGREEEGGRDGEGGKDGEEGEAGSGGGGGGQGRGEYGRKEEVGREDGAGS